MILANMSNGLAFPPYDDICYFQSQYGHSAKNGYFNVDALPISAIVELLKGNALTLIDATRKNKALTDAFKFGVPTFALVFNRAISIYDKSYRKVRVCDWQTPEMVQVANSKIHEPTKQKIRKLIKLYGYKCPAVIGDNIGLIVHQGFIGDDKPKRIKERIYEKTGFE